MKTKKLSEARLAAENEKAPPRLRVERDGQFKRPNWGSVGRRPLEYISKSV
jgi:hypothetical protein